MANVAFLFSGVGDLSGGGGAERFFSSFFEDYNKLETKHNLFFISDKESLLNFNKLGNLNKSKQVLTYKLIHNRYKNILEAIQLTRLIVKHKIKLIQVPLYGMQYYKLIKHIDSLPSAIRPKIAITIVDSFIPHHYLLPDDRYNFAGVFGNLFNNVKVDGVICWNELFKTFAEENAIIKSKPHIYSIRSRYTSKNFDANKKKSNHMVFAGRLTDAKRPLMFIEAIHVLKNRNFNFEKWKFFIYGKGHLEKEIKEKIENYGLSDLVTVSHQINLTKVLEESKCFVSTQDFENFPSLSMNEAMAAGNAIIARNVGQTDLFVRHGVNGLLIDPDNEQGLANAIEEYIGKPQKYISMGTESLILTKKIHNFENFKIQMEEFWDKILNAN